jgi:mono/diheme cytochrome c family protein
MPSFHAVLTSQDVNDLLAFARSEFSWQDVIAGEEPTTEATAASEEASGPGPSFSADVLPVLTEKCALCHGSAGGWSAATYDEVVNGGLNAPAVIPGDPEKSLLVQKLRDTQTQGGLMPPTGPLPMEEIELIVRWIAAGAPDN